MIKKCFLALVFMALGLGAVFAQTDFYLSAGAGLYFTSDFGGGFTDPEYDLGNNSYKLKTTMKMPYYGAGGFAFLDAVYAELSAGFFCGIGKVDLVYGPSSQGFYRLPSKYDSLYLGLDMGVFGKYPIDINRRVSVFPLLGITYRVMLFADDPYGEGAHEHPGDFNTLWFKAGGGADYNLTDTIYLRGAFTYGLRLPSPFEKGHYTMGGPRGDIYPGHGLDVKVTVGIRFYSASGYFFRRKFL